MVLPWMFNWFGCSMFATEWLRARPALRFRWSGVLSLGLVGLVLWFVWWRGPGRAGLSETPLPSVAMSEALTLQMHAIQHREAA